jgi:hypothetical protein
METSITGIIKNVQMIEVSEIGMQFIYGTVEHDSLGRWEPEDWMVSSPIERIDIENLLVYTQNSIYKVDLLSEPILLSYEQFLLVRQGLPPDCIKQSK